MKNFQIYIIIVLVCSSLILIGYRITPEKKIILEEQELPIVLNGIIFTAENVGNVNEMEVFEKIESDLGIEVQFNQINNNERILQKKYIMQSNEIPDFIMGSNIPNRELLAYVNEEKIIPLDDLINSYAPHIQALFEEKPFVKQASTFLGDKIYTLPFYNEMKRDLVDNYLFINKTWLEELELEMPTTTEEFYQVLRAFKTQDPNKNGQMDEIPFSYIESNSKYNADSFIGAFGMVDNGKMIMIKDGEAKFVPGEEGYKEAILYLRKLYQEELLDAEIFTQSLEQYIEKGKNEVPIVGAFIAKDSGIVVGENRAIDNYVVVPPLEGPHGDRLWGKKVSQFSSNQFMITTKNQHPEMTIAWVDQFFNPDRAPEIVCGAEGVTIEKIEGNYYFLKPPKGKSYIEHAMENSAMPACPGMLTKEIESKFSYNPIVNRKNHWYNKYEPYFVKENICVSNQFQIDFMKESGIQKSLNRYIYEMKTRWIAGQYSIEEDWEKYQNTLKSLNADAYRILYELKYNECKHLGEHMMH
ncbi:MAG: extracellular solute-binding protein [Niameybacter sp.]